LQSLPGEPIETGQRRDETPGSSDETLLNDHKTRELQVETLERKLETLDTVV
jgi:hypothetical protein